MSTEYARSSLKSKCILECTTEMKYILFTILCTTEMRYIVVF
jgi:hypothetical protein